MDRLAAELDLWLLDRLSAYDIRYSDDQPRDKHGRFGSTGGGSGGVRESLKSAATPSEVSSAASAEAKRITGRDVSFDMAGADVQIAQEHSEGVLRGLEHAPGAPLVGVGTYGPGGSLGAEWDGDEGNAGESNGVIGFNNAVSGSHNADAYRADLRDNAESGFNSGDGSVMSVGVHEVGHVAASRVSEVTAERTVQGMAEHLGRNPQELVESEVSTNATRNTHELVAEAFTDVVVNGDSASELSHQIYQSVVYSAGQK